MRKKTIEVEELCYGNIVKHGDDIVRITEIQKEYCRVFNITKGRTAAKLIPISEFTRLNVTRDMMEKMFGQPFIMGSVIKGYNKYMYDVYGISVWENDISVTKGLHHFQNFVKFRIGKQLKTNKLFK